MITRHEVLISLYGVWRLFIRDPRGIEWLDDSIDGYWKSFFCALLILPGYILWLAYSSDTLYQHISLLRIVSAEGIGYVISWVAWPLAMAYIAPVIGCDDRYIRYIVAYNWSGGVQIVLTMVVLALRFITQMPEGFATLLTFIVLVVLLFYHWFIVRVSLEVPPAGAVGLVAGEFILGRFIRVMTIAVMSG